METVNYHKQITLLKNISHNAPSPKPRLVHGFERTGNNPIVESIGFDKNTPRSDSKMSTLNFVGALVEKNIESVSQYFDRLDEVNSEANSDIIVKDKGEEALPQATNQIDHLRTL